MCVWCVYVGCVCVCVCVCACVCVSVCGQDVRAHICAHIHPDHTVFHLCVCVGVRACVRGRACVRVCVVRVYVRT
jgi:hypothetical protein